ncbi:MAG: hypothetical protein ACUVRY_09130 [Thermoanaerobaculaceae bacterium]
MAKRAMLSRGDFLRPGRSHRIVDKIVVKLRRVLEEKPQDPRWLIAVWACGYRLVVADSVGNRVSKFRQEHFRGGLCK